MRCYFLLAIAAGPVLAQVQPEAVDLIRRSETALDGFRSGEIETENTGIYQTTHRPLTIKASLVWSAPDKVRLTIGSETAGETSVTDGHTLSSYLIITHEYTHEQAALPIAAAQRRALGALIRMEKDETISSARIVGDEQLSLRDSKHKCSVIEANIRTANGLRSYTLWIDKGTGLILKQHIVSTNEQNGMKTKSESSLVVRHLALNTQINDRVFVFAPPEGAKVVDRPTYREGASFEGKSMPDLEFQSVDRTPFSMEALRGRSVILSFGTTTCQPWRSQLDELRRARSSLEQRGAAIVLVVQNETADAAREWQKTNGLEFPLIVARTWRFSSCPINFVIDKNGTVSSVEVGVQPESRIIEMLGSPTGQRPAK